MLPLSGEINDDDQWRRNEFESGGQRSGAKVGGTCRVWMAGWVNCSELLL